MLSLESALTRNVGVLSCLIFSMSACGGGVFERRDPQDLTMTVCDTGKEGYKIIGDTCQPVFPPEMVAKDFVWEKDAGRMVPVLKIMFDREVTFSEGRKEVGLGLISSEESGGLQKLELFQATPDSFQSKIMKVRVLEGMQGDYQLTLPVLVDQYGNTKLGGIIKLENVDLLRPTLEAAKVVKEEGSQTYRLSLEFSEILLFSGLYLYRVEDANDKKPKDFFNVQVNPGATSYEVNLGKELTSGYYYLVVLDGKDGRNNPYASQNALIHIQE